MTAQEAYVKGFCKTAAAYGADPVQLAKYAATSAPAAPAPAPYAWDGTEIKPVTDPKLMGDPRKSVYTDDIADRFGPGVSPSTDLGYALRGYYGDPGALRDDAMLNNDWSDNEDWNRNTTRRWASTAFNEKLREIAALDAIRHAPRTATSPSDTDYRNLAMVSPGAAAQALAKMTPGAVQSLMRAPNPQLYDAAYSAGMLNPLELYPAPSPTHAESWTDTDPYGPGAGSVADMLTSNVGTLRSTYPNAADAMYAAATNVLANTKPQLWDPKTSRPTPAAVGSIRREGPWQ